MRCKVRLVQMSRREYTKKMIAHASCVLSMSCFFENPEEHLCTAVAVKKTAGGCSKNNRPSTAHPPEFFYLARKPSTMWP